jgi:hypothetical protein
MYIYIAMTPQKKEAESVRGKTQKAERTRH